MKSDPKHYHDVLEILNSADMTLSRTSDYKLLVSHSEPTKVEVIGSNKNLPEYQISEALAFVNSSSLSETTEHGKCGDYFLNSSDSPKYPVPS